MPSVVYLRPDGIYETPFVGWEKLMNDFEHEQFQIAQYHDARDRLDRLAAACLPVVYEDHEPPERNAHWAIALALALRDAVDAALKGDPNHDDS